MSKEVKEPAVRMIKRDTISTAKAWGIRLIAVVLSLIVAGLVIVLMMIIPAINELFSTIKSVFGLW